MEPCLLPSYPSLPFSIPFPPYPVCLFPVPDPLPPDSAGSNLADKRLLVHSDSELEMSQISCWIKLSCLQMKGESCKGEKKLIKATKITFQSVLSA